MHVTISKTDRFWTVRVREGSDFETVGYPEWAQRIAIQHSNGARVRLGKPAANGWLVEVVRLSRQYVPDRETAEELAREIVEAIER